MVTSADDATILVVVEVDQITKRTKSKIYQRTCLFKLMNFTNKTTLACPKLSIETEFSFQPQQKMTFNIKNKRDELGIR